MNPDEIAHLRTDLLDFTRHMFRARKGAEFAPNLHQQTICSALERVVIGDITRLIVNVPPRSGKTDLGVVNWIPWCMGNFPDAEFIHASYSKRLATHNTYQARALMQNEAYAEVFGPPSIAGDSNAKDEFRTTQGGVVYATGAEGTITGYGAGKMRQEFGGAIVIDDPHKAGEGNSDTMRQNVLDWFSTTIESRKNAPHTPIILIMQRLHEDDLAGYLLRGGNGEEWAHINIPAVTDEGDSFWPGQFPIEDLRRMEKADPYRFAGQYMQSPAPIGGGIFKDHWWGYWETPPKLKWRAIYADTAQKTKTHNDYSVFQHWGCGEDGRAYMLDQMRGKWEAPDLLERAHEFWSACTVQSWGCPVRAFKIEDKVSGTGLIQQLKREGIPVQAIQRDKDKLTRAMDVVPQIASGHVYLQSGAPWVREFLAEVSIFPNGKHDDQVDPMIDAVADIRLQAPKGAPRVRTL